MFKMTLFISILTLILTGCAGGTGGVWTQMKKNDMVRIAVDASSIPFEFGSVTGVKGFDVDLGDSIAEDLGYPVRWVKAGFEQLFALLRNGQVEMVLSAVAITPERQKEFAFSKPYFNSGDAIARRKDRWDIKDLGTLSGKKVGVLTGRTAEAFITSQTSAANVSLIRYSTFDDAFQDLGNSELDAVVGDYSIMTYSIYESYPYLMTLDRLLNHTQYAVVVRARDRRLLARIDGTIERLGSSGELTAWRNKWFQNVLQQAGDEWGKMLKEREEAEALKMSPKTIVCAIVKRGGNFNLDDLDGFPINLTGPAGSFQSTPVDTNGSRGSCSFARPIPPGKYSLNFPELRISAPIVVPETPARSLNLEMIIGKAGVEFTWR
jgi:ABC-type amino acid transport substrate-binding protein